MRLQGEASLTQQKQQHEQSLRTLEISMREETDRWKAELQSATAITVAQISAKASADKAEAAANAKVEKDLADA